jgi:hypothetical protein
MKLVRGKFVDRSAKHYKIRVQLIGLFGNRIGGVSRHDNMIDRNSMRLVEWRKKAQPLPAIRTFPLVQATRHMDDNQLFVNDLLRVA